MKNYYILLISIVFICGLVLTAFGVFAHFSSALLFILTVILFVLLGLSIKIKKDLYGDIVVLKGRLRRPFSYGKKSNFDYRKYLANKRIYSILNVKKGAFLKGGIVQCKLVQWCLFRKFYTKK